ncbi:MAG: hypothetical protein FWE46_04585 [Coriobacteriia bacterium]|nr:hypothetical protein [Coriobacteriia bacterium]
MSEQYQQYSPPVPPQQGQATAALKNHAGSFFSNLRAKDSFAPPEISDSMFWINWLRRITIVLFWLMQAGVTIAALGVLLSGFRGGMWGGPSIGDIVMGILGAVIVLLVGTFLAITLTALYMIILNWARDTAVLRYYTEVSNRPASPAPQPAADPLVVASSTSTIEQ